MWTTLFFSSNNSYYSGKREILQAICPFFEKHSSIFIVEKKWTGCEKRVEKKSFLQPQKTEKEKEKIKREKQKGYSRIYSQCGENKEKLFTLS